MLSSKVAECVVGFIYTISDWLTLHHLMQIEELLVLVQNKS